MHNNKSKGTKTTKTILKKSKITGKISIPSFKVLLQPWNSRSIAREKETWTGQRTQKQIHTNIPNNF